MPAAGISNTQGARVKAVAAMERDLAQVRFARRGRVHAGAVFYASSAEVGLCGRRDVGGLCRLGKACGTADEVGGERWRSAGGQTPFAAGEARGVGEPQFPGFGGTAEHGAANGINRMRAVGGPDVN